jgi:hypothetical protein
LPVGVDPGAYALCGQPRQKVGRTATLGTTSKVCQFGAARRVVGLAVQCLWWEHEIDGDAQGPGEPPDLAEGRHRLVGLPAADRGDVDAKQVGQVLLGRRWLHAQAESLELLTVGHADPPRPVL